MTAKTDHGFGQLLGNVIDSTTGGMESAGDYLGQSSALYLFPELLLSIAVRRQAYGGGGEVGIEAIGVGAVSMKGPALLCASSSLAFS